MRLKGKFALSLTLLFILVLASSVFFFRQEREREIEKILEAEEEEVGFFGAHIEQAIEGYIKDIKVIENLPPIQGIVRAREAANNIDPLDGSSLDEWKKRLEQTYTSILSVKPFYMQLRYLDENGREIVRVDATPDGPYVIPKEELQDKSGRDYFQEAKTVSAGQIYVSKFDLNVEEGKVEAPYRPVLRIAKGVWSNEGEFRGMVIANIDPNEIFNYVREKQKEEAGNLVLLDENGQYLVNPTSPEKEFGILLGTGEVNEHYLVHKEFILGGEQTTAHIIGKHDKGELLDAVVIHHVIYYNPSRSDQFIVLLEDYPNSSVLMPIESRFRARVIILSLIFGLGFLTFFFFLVGPLIKGILRNKAATDLIRKGDFSARVEVKGKDEVSEIAQGINLMAEELGKREEQLRAEKASVEKKVEMRTLQLRREKARLMSSINSLSIGFIIADTHHNILVKNSIVAKIFGVDDSEISISTISKKLGDKFDLTSYCEEAIKEKKGLEKKEISYDSKFLRIFIAPVIVHEEAEKVIGYVLLMEDITEAKLLERAKDEFLSIASHELRTPLTAIRGNASLMLEYFGQEVKKNKDLEEIVSDTHKSSVRLIKIVNDFLDASRLEQGRVEFKKEKFDLVSLTEEVIGQLQTIAKSKGLYLRLEKPWPNLPQALADKDRTRQVINNLVGNAINYTKKGGVTIKIIHRDGFLEVRVIDTGVGISRQNQKLLFRKFQQAGKRVLARDVTRGTGMGLYISKLLTEGMGGNVYLERSEVGRGSTFVFTLPAVESKEIGEKASSTAFAKPV